jgi:hypothetical protein
VAPVFALVTSVRNPEADNTFERFEGPNTKNLENLYDSNTQSFSILHKRDRDYNQYAETYPDNQIPDFVTCNTRGGGNSMMYAQDDIWRALETGYAYLQNGVPLAQYPRYGARTYPSGFRGADQALQGTPTGNGDWQNMYEFPLRPFYGNPWNGNGIRPDADRVVFDFNGVYMGVITHRGEVGNAFQYTSPFSKTFYYLQFLTSSQTLVGHNLQTFGRSLYSSLECLATVYVFPISILMAAS